MRAELVAVLSLRASRQERAASGILVDKETKGIEARHWLRKKS